MKRIVGISLAITLLCTSCNTATKPEFNTGGSSGSGPGSVSIAHLKSLCRVSPTPLTGGLTITGVVTANDIQDEFPNALILQDATGGIEISVDYSGLHALFPLGSQVSVLCTGLALGDYGGKIRLGAYPEGSYSIDRIPGAELGRYLRCTSFDSHRTPRTLHIDDVGPAEIDTYICFENVHFVEAGLEWCDHDPETGAPTAARRTLTDDAGHEFAVRISGDCHYATKPIPQGTGSVNGIIDYFNGEYSLRIVNYEIFLSTSATPPTACPSVAGCSAPTPRR